MATYKQIQDRVTELYGYSAITGWIADIKEYHGLTTRIAVNRIDPTKRVNPCPPEKWADIEDVMRSFGMIKQPKSVILASQSKGADTSNKPSKKTEPKSVKKNPWIKFKAETLKLDSKANPRKPNGYHWFWGLYHLGKKIRKISNFDIKAIKNKIPDEHWLKKESVPTNTDKLHSLVDILVKDLGNPEKIKSIGFSEFNSNENANFSNFIFPINTTFSETTFDKNASFKNALFLKEVFFIRVTFAEIANFKNTVFCGGTAKFKGATFKKIADFTNARFENHANFKGSTFSERTVFQQATFKIHAPLFYGATFNKEIIWNNIILPKPPKVLRYLLHAVLRWKGYRWADVDHKPIVRDNQNSYEYLANCMEELNKYHDRHFFFREEMRCRRRLEGPFNFTTYGIYELLANYGYGVGRALLGWFLHICFWAVIMFLFVFCGKTLPERITCSALTSLSNAHSFFLSKGQGLSSCNIEGTASKNTMLAFDFIWAIETMFGAFFLFLLLLTLRVRFRLGSTTNNTTINLPAEK